MKQRMLIKENIPLFLRFCAFDYYENHVMGYKMKTQRNSESEQDEKITAVNCFFAKISFKPLIHL